MSEVPTIGKMGPDVVPRSPGGDRGTAGVVRWCAWLCCVSRIARMRWSTRPRFRVSGVESPTLVEGRDPPDTTEQESRLIIDLNVARESRLPSRTESRLQNVTTALGENSRKRMILKRNKRKVVNSIQVCRQLGPSVPPGCLPIVPRFS